METEPDAQLLPGALIGCRARPETRGGMFVSGPILESTCTGPDTSAGPCTLPQDLGYNNIGYHNHVTLSPHIDEFFGTGLQLNHSFSHKWCAPTRGALMSGRLPFKTGLEVSTYTQAIPSTTCPTRKIAETLRLVTVRLARGVLGSGVRAGALRQLHAAAGDAEEGRLHDAQCADNHPENPNKPLAASRHTAPTQAVSSATHKLRLHYKQNTSGSCRESRLVLLYDSLPV